MDPRLQLGEPYQVRHRPRLPWDGLSLPCHVQRDSTGLRRPVHDGFRLLVTIPGMRLPGMAQAGYDKRIPSERRLAWNPTLAGCFPMLQILGSPKRLCNGLTRREMLVAGGLSLLGVGLSDYLRLADAQANPA